MSDLPSDSSTNGVIAVGGSLDGTINGTGDRDWVRIDLAPGQWVQVTQASSGSDPLDDPLLRIYDANGNLVTTDDELDSNNLNYDASAIFGGGIGGTYYIEAGAYRDLSEGNYTLTATEVNEPSGNLIDVLDSGNQQTDNTVTVYFAEAGETVQYTVGNQIIDSSTSDAWSDYEKQRFEAGLAAIAAVTNLTFEIVASATDADIRLSLNTSDFSGPSELGYFYYPMGSPVIGGFNSEGFGWNTDGGLEVGGLGYATIVHEVLHGLGLAHLHDGDTVLEGVEVDFDDFGVNGLNQGIFSTMSYNGGYADEQSFSYNYGNEAGPMALDIATLQSIYGANTTTASGDDVYELPDSNSVGTAWMTIWDTGGDDTIEYNGTRDVTIDLRPASLTLGEGGGGFISAASGIAGGFTIANGVIIENATGGSGDDALIGNDADNTLTGNGGDDLLFGGIGDDELIGGNGADILLGGAGEDTIDGGGGNDTASGGIGDDDITAGANNDTVSGDSGDDTIFGTSGTNILNGNSGADTIEGGSGTDTINGGSGNDTLRGNAGSDIIDGGRGHDIIEGSAGFDILTGGLGADTLSGGSGADDFVFTSSIDSAISQQDTITDFETGIDDIDLSSIYSGTLSFIGNDTFSAAGQVRVDASGMDGLVQVDRDGDGIAEMQIVLTGVTSLTEGDFIL